ncbi:MAG TPA: hypothetical protein VEC11_08685 [Allosphingosinicella sp.]|nr:hypothetical protein [Allosphingosinicella sp.]
MASPKDGVVRFYEIAGDGNDDAVYNYHVTTPAGGRDPKDVVRDAVRDGRLPTGGNRPGRGYGGPERYLDISETRSGHCTYAFVLNARRMNEQRLQFVDEPFVPLPLNLHTGEAFLTDFELGYDGGGLWASFSCDTDAVRNSDFVRGLGGHDGKGLSRRDHDEELHEHHPVVLTLPFTFNLIDPFRRAAPWIFPNESHLHPMSQYTHGGIHPSMVSYLALTL